VGGDFPPLDLLTVIFEVSNMEKLHLPIIVEIDEDGYYIVTCPLFKGCHSYGETIDEAMENINEVIDMCLEETKIEELNKFVGFRELEVAQNA
jgi:predicted RNase H-like HicB family nuclease